MVGFPRPSHILTMNVSAVWFHLLLSMSMLVALKWLQDLCVLTCNLGLITWLVYAIT